MVEAFTPHGEITFYGSTPIKVPPPCVGKTMKLIHRGAYGFSNFENYRTRVRGVSETPPKVGNVPIFMSRATLQDEIDSSATILLY